MIRDRFDFEQAIMNCWNIVEDIKLISQMNDIRDLSEDELMNALLGLETLYQMKFEILFNGFERMIKDGQIK
jgi:hypothetical protein